jgi:hypothetical protein
MANDENRQDPGEKATHAPQLTGLSTSLSTGAAGTPGEHGVTPGEVPASSNVFGTTVTEKTGAPGTSGGQHKVDSQSVSHTQDSADAVSYNTVTTEGGVTPTYDPIVGTYPTDTGAGEGHLLIGGRHPHAS